MKLSEELKKFREMKDSELVVERTKLKKEFTLTSLKVKVGKQSDISQVKKLKKNIARINSLISERMYGASNE